MAVVSNGTTLIDAGALGASAGAGKLTLIKTLTASSDSTLNFVNGASSVVFDSTYDVYIFKFINIHVSSNDAVFRVNFRDGGTNYDTTKTTSFFRSYHAESGSPSALTYSSSHDLANSTSAQDIITSNGSGNDESASGMLTIFNPGSTTFVKHFYSDCSVYHGGDLAQRLLVGGYCNVTAAVDAVQFEMETGNIDAGTIKLYGVG